MDDIQWRKAVEETLKGNKKAFDELYRATERAVYFTCLKMVADEDTAEDLMQETFMTALERLETIGDGEKFPMWINRIAVNKCLHHFRGKAVSSLEEQAEQGKEIEDDESFIPEEYVTDEAKRKIIMDIINNVLSDVQRQVVIMYYYDEMSLEEIAETMGCPLKTVSSRLCTAREKIREAVLIYEKKHDDRLHMLIPVPILTQILRKEAESVCVPDISQVLTASHFFNTAAAASANTSTVIAGGSSKMVGGILSGKVIAAIAAGVIAVGGVTTAFVLSKGSKGGDSSVVASSSVSAADSSSSKAEASSASSAYESDNSDSSSEVPEVQRKLNKASVYNSDGLNVIIPPRYNDEINMGPYTCHDFCMQQSYGNSYYGALQFAFERSDATKSYTTEQVKEWFEKNRSSYKLLERIQGLFFVTKENVESKKTITIAGKEFIRETGTYKVTCDMNIELDVSYVTLCGKADFQGEKDNAVYFTAYSTDTDPAKKKELETTIDNIAKGLEMTDSEAAAFAETITDDYLTFTHIEPTVTAPGGTKGVTRDAGVYSILVPQQWYLRGYRCGGDDKNKAELTESGTTSSVMVRMTDKNNATRWLDNAKQYHAQDKFEDKHDVEFSCGNISWHGIGFKYADSKTDSYIVIGQDTSANDRWFYIEVIGSEPDSALSQDIISSIQIHEVK